jgi:mucin-19
VAVNTAAGVFSDKNVENGKIVTLSSTYTGADVGNYIIASQATATADITPKALTVSGLVANNKAYDGTTSATVNTAGASYAGLVAGDAVVVSANGVFADKNVGNGKTVTLSSTYGGADAGNYVITGQTSATANITQAALTVRANDITKTVDTAYSFAGTEFSATGLVAGETIGSALLSSPGASPGAAVGPYAITASGATGGSFSLSNYNVTYLDGSMTVVAAPPVPPAPPVAEVASTAVVVDVGERMAAAIRTAEQTAPRIVAQRGAASEGIRFTLIDAGINLPQGVE